MSVLLSSFLIHFNSSHRFTLKSSFFGSLEYQQRDIESLVHQLEDPDNLCVAANLYQRKRQGNKNDSSDEGDSPQDVHSSNKVCVENDKLSYHRCFLFILVDNLKINVCQRYTLCVFEIFLSQKRMSTTIELFFCDIASVIFAL